MKSLVLILPSSNFAVYSFKRNKSLSEIGAKTKDLIPYPFIKSFLISLIDLPKNANWLLAPVISSVTLVNIGYLDDYWV